MTSRRWEPLFRGPDAIPFERIVHDIQQDTKRLSVPWTDWGKVLLTTYLAAKDGSQSMETARTALDEMVGALSQLALRPGLFGGVAGVGWGVAHVSSVLDGRPSEDFTDIDQALIEFVDRCDHTDSYDLVSGLVGVGVYFLERLPHPSAVIALHQLVDVFWRNADQINGMARWHTHASVLPEWQRKLAPNGYYNLGVAHGMPGVIGLLSQICRRGIAHARLRPLLHSAVNWVLSNLSEDRTLPSWITSSATPSVSRVAWCYGELGASVPLLAAARVLQDDRAEREVLEVAERCAQRRHKTGVVDAGLCHGAAGNAHLFNRLFQATRRRSFWDAAHFWFEWTLLAKHADRGVGGYQSRQSRKENTAEFYWEDDASFLTGATGIALAVLAALTPVEPTWDQVLLCQLDLAPTDPEG